jgi:hypothetical protein
MSNDIGNEQVPRRINLGQLTSGINSAVGGGLSIHLSTHLKRKGKAVILTALEFILSLVVMLVDTVNRTPDKTVGTGVFIVLGVSALYALCLMIFTYIHSAKLSPTLMSRKDIEEAFQYTNAIPFVDGLLELPLPSRFGGNIWYLPYIFWSIFLAIQIAIFVVFGVLKEYSRTTVTAIVLEITQLYQVTSDFSEYWVHTRHTIEIVDKPEEGNVN